MRDMDPERRRQLRLEIAQLDDHQVINVEMLAALLDTTPGNIYRLLCRSPESLPPRIPAFGRRKVWMLGTVHAWLKARSPASDGSSASAARPRRGRPRGSA